MLKLFLWLRYLRKKKIVLLSITAVALSVALLLVVANLFTGFINAFEASAVESLGDVIITPPVRLAKYPLLLDRLEESNAIDSATPVLSAPGLLHLGKGMVRAVMIWGIEPASRQKVTGFKRFLLKAKNLPAEPSFDFADNFSGFIGISVVCEPNDKTDEYDFNLAESFIARQFILTTGSQSTPTAKEQKSFKRKTLKFTASDIIFTGIYQFDKEFVYLPISQLQEVLYPDQTEPVAGQIQIKLTRGVAVDSAIAQIRGIWQQFAADELHWAARFITDTSIITSGEMQSRYVAELRKQMGLLLVIFGIVSLSVVLLISCIFYMIVITRQKDIAIIKSCGASSISVGLIFTGFGACVGVAGSAVGTVLGFIITKNINTIEHYIRIIFGLKLWKSSVYIFSRIPSEVNWPWAVSIAAAAVAAAAAGALIPAIVAAMTRPVEILRYE